MPAASAAGDARPPVAPRPEPRPAERRPRVLERGFEFRGRPWTAKLAGAAAAAASFSSGTPILHVRFEPAVPPPLSSGRAASGAGPAMPVGPASPALASPASPAPPSPASPSPSPPGPASPKAFSPPPEPTSPGRASPQSLAAYVVAADLADMSETQLQDVLAERIDATALPGARPGAVAEGRRPLR